MYMGVPTFLGAWTNIGINYNAMLESWKLESLRGTSTGEAWQRGQYTDDPQ